MSGVIWVASKQHFQQGMKMIEAIIKKYKLQDIQVITKLKTTDRIFIDFVNGDRWGIIIATTSERGLRTNFSIIDDTISLDYINEVIKPKTYIQNIYIHFN